MGEGHKVNPEKIHGRPWGMAFLLVIFLFAPLRAQDSTSDGGTASQIKKNLHQNKKDLVALQKKLAEEKKAKHLAEIKEKRVLSHLQAVDQKLGKLRREKEANEQDLRETRIRLAQLRSEKSLNQQTLNQDKKLLKRRLLALYRMSFRQPFLGGLLETDSLSDLARKLKFEMIMAESNEKILSQTLQSEQKLDDESSQWNENDQRERRILSTLGRQETGYSQEQQNKTTLLTSIRHQKEVRERAIEELSQAAQELQEKVSALLRAAQERGRETEAWVPPAGGLKIKRGRIPWPVSGTIIQFFGKTKNPEFKEVVDNSGIQIQAPYGAPIKAVADGKVRYADWFKGYGKLVILDHGGGYYSLYAQASELEVTEGEEVVAGQELGKVGDTGSLVGTSLYFEIRKNGIPQDPTRWLEYRTQ